MQQRSHWIDSDHFFCHGAVMHLAWHSLCLHHLGATCMHKTMEIGFWWRTLRQNVEHIVWTCSQCQHKQIVVNCLSRMLSKSAAHGRGLMQISQSCCQLKHSGKVCIQCFHCDLLLSKMVWNKKCLNALLRLCQQPLTKCSHLDAQDWLESSSDNSKKTKACSTKSASSSRLIWKLTSDFNFQKISAVKLACMALSNWTFELKETRPMIRVSVWSCIHCESNALCHAAGRSMFFGILKPLSHHSHCCTIEVDCHVQDNWWKSDNSTSSHCPEAEDEGWLKVDKTLLTVNVFATCGAKKKQTRHVFTWINQNSDVV